MGQSFTGQVINGYTVGPILGMGGMGEVYQATSPDGSQVCAIKFLRKEYTNHSQLQARFVREIRIMEAIDHPNIIPIYEYGQIDGQLYYIMRLNSGMSLMPLMSQKKFSPLTYWKVLAQLAAALQCAHDHHIVHRDIKPSNVFIERTDDDDLHLYLGDFGLGRRYSGSYRDPTVTDIGAIVGTPHYLSPEAILGKTPTTQSDIYALGVLTYRALLGRLPFHEGHAHQIAIAHVTRAVPLPSSLVRDFPESLETLILLALAKKPDDRPASVEMFADEYLEILRQLPEDTRKKVYYVDDKPGTIE